MSTTLAWAQEKVDYKSWKLGVNVSPEMGYRFLKTDSNDTMVNYILTQRNGWEIPALMFSTGISIEYRISKLISIRSGVLYSLRGENSKDLGFGHDYNGFGTYVEKWIYRNRYHNIGVPIICSFHFLDKEKNQFFASIGVSLDYLYLRSTRNTMKIHNEEEETNFDKATISDDNYNDYNIFNPSGLVSFGMDLKLGSKSTLRIEPNFKISFLPLLNAPIEAQYYNYGLNIGYLYTLK